MDKDLRKRLEEAADAICNCQGCPSIFMYGGCKKECVMHEFYKRGAELGYKEAIALAKEWIQKNVPIIHTEEGDYVRVNMGHKNVPMNKYLAAFETYMNKLWEGEK